MKRKAIHRRPPAEITLVAVLAIVYILGGKLGLKLAFVNEYATAIWPPTGIALMGLLLGGYRLWPGVLIGALVVNLTTGHFSVSGTLASIAIAVGNTLEALLGAYLVNKCARGARAFDRAADVFAFTLVAAIVSTTVSATFGVASLLLAGLAKSVNASDIWLTWWIGDAGGELVFAPALILWVTERHSRWNYARPLEAVLLTVCLSLLFLSVFTDVFSSGPAHLALAILCVPPLMWVAFRLGQREAATAILLLSCIAVWGATHGLRMGQDSRAEVLLEVQAYLAITSVMVLAVAAEVSERRRHELEQKHLAETLREQAQVMDLACVLVRDTGDRITRWSSGAQSLYGFTSAEAVGRISHELFETRFGEPLEQIRARLFADGRWRGELRHKTRDGREIAVASLQALHRDKNSIPAAILEVNNDITDQQRAEDSLRATQEQLQLVNATLTRANEDLERFAFLASHDLQEPLRMITIYAQLLIKSYPGQFDGEASMFMANIVDGTTRMRELLTDLLAYTGIGSHLEVPVEAVDLNLIVDHVRQNLKASIDEAGAIVTSDSLPTLRAYAAHFTSLFQNLIANAIKYRSEQPPQVRVSVHEADGQLRFAVSDNGMGIDPEYHEQIFEVFKRLHGTKIPGTGIGLAICQRVVERYDGRIWVESRVGEGATFLFTMPSSIAIHARVESP